MSSKPPTRCSLSRVYGLSTRKTRTGVLERSPLMKTASRFHLYVLDGGRIAGLAETGLETERLEDPALIEEPALVLLAPGQTAPADLAPIALEIPVNMPAATIRELVRVA